MPCVFTLATFGMSAFGFSALTLAMAACVLPGFAQTVSLSVPAQSSGAKEAPSTLTLKDALALAEKNDPAMLAATSDATRRKRGP